MPHHVVGRNINQMMNIARRGEALRRRNALLAANRVPQDAGLAATLSTRGSPLRILRTLCSALLALFAVGAIGAAGLLAVRAERANPVVAQEGSTGDEVVKIQTALRDDWGFAIAVDGAYG